MKPKKEYGIVLVGCGYIGAQHMQDIYFLENIKIVGVVDSDENAARLFARKYGAASWSTDYKLYLDDDRVDIAIIATHAGTHLEMLKAFTLHGKHVLCEKPIAPDYERAMEFIDVMRRAQTRVLVGYILRHNESYQKIARLIRSGTIGQTKVIRFVQNHKSVHWERYLALLADCSPVVDCGVHYIDVAQWFTGARIIRVSGVASQIDEDLPFGSYNYGMLNGELSDGTVFFYEVGWSRSMPVSHIREFIGDEGHIRLVNAADRTDGHQDGDLIILYSRKTKETRLIDSPGEYKNMKGQLYCLIDMIENGSEGSPDVEDVESTNKVIFAADRALRERRVIRLDDLTQDILEGPVK